MNPTDPSPSPIPDAPLSPDTFERDLKMLSYFQEEFLYRHKLFWGLLMKFFVLSVVISMLPVTSEIFGISLHSLPRPVTCAFPIVGILVSLLGYWILRQEAVRLSNTQEAKYRINQQMPRQYQYKDFGKYALPAAGDTSPSKKSTAYPIANIALLVELLIAGVVLVFLYCSVPPPAV